MVATRARGSAFKRALVEAPLETTLEVQGPYGDFVLPEEPSEIVMLAGGIGVTPFRAMAEDARERSLDHTLSLIHSNRTPEEAPFLEELIRWGLESANETPADRRDRRRREREAGRVARGAETGGVRSAIGPAVPSTRPAAGMASGGFSPEIDSVVDDPTKLGPAPVVPAGAAGVVGARAATGPHFRYLPLMTQADRSGRGWDGERRRVSPDYLRDVLPADVNAPTYYVAGPERFVNGAIESLRAVGVKQGRIHAEEFPGY